VEAGSWSGASLLGISLFGRRLLRRLCMTCAAVTTQRKKTWAISACLPGQGGNDYFLSGQSFPHAERLSAQLCKKGGYKGRVGVYESTNHEALSTRNRRVASTVLSADLCLGFQA